MSSYIEHPATRWHRHEYRGWVCQRCGYVATGQAARDIHDRRALRGLGCYASSKTPNAGIQPKATAASR